jgi:hypothetical protein
MANSALERYTLSETDTVAATTPGAAHASNYLARPAAADLVCSQRVEDNPARTRAQVLRPRLPSRSRGPVGSLWAVRAPSHKQHHKKPPSFHLRSRAYTVKPCWCTSDLVPPFCGAAAASAAAAAAAAIQMQAEIRMLKRLLAEYPATPPPHRKFPRTPSDREMVPFYNKVCVRRGCEKGEKGAGGGGG